MGPNGPTGAAWPHQWALKVPTIRMAYYLAHPRVAEHGVVPNVARLGRAAMKALASASGSIRRGGGEAWGAGRWMRNHGTLIRFVSVGVPAGSTSPPPKRQDNGCEEDKNKIKRKPKKYGTDTEYLLRARRWPCANLA